MPIMIMGAGGGDKVNGVIKEYAVNTGESIAKGDFVSIVSSGSVSVSSPSTLVSGALTGDNTLTINISDNKFLIIYNKNDNKLYAKVVNYTTAFDNNTETNIFNGRGDGLYAVKMSNGDIVLSFIYNYNQCYMCRLHINGNYVEIAITPTLILNESASWFLFTLLSDTLAVASKYYQSSYSLKRAVVISISESTISILNNSTGPISLYADGGFVYKINETKCALVIGEVYNYYNRVYTITTNGSSNPTFSITGDSYPQNKNAELSYYNGLQINEKTAVLVGTSNIYNTKLFLSFVDNIKDNNEVVMSYPTKINDDAIYTGYTNRISPLALMDNNLLLISYKLSSNNYGRLCVFDLKDNGIFDAITFNDTITHRFSVARLNSTKGVVFYNKYVDGSTQSGDVRIVTLPTTYVKPYDGTGILGIAKSGGSAGETIKVFIPE